MTAAVRALLLRRRAPAPPSLAVLQPLFPRRGSTSRSPLLAAAAAVGLPDVRRPQLSPPAPAPPLLRLRHYSSKPPSKGCEPPPQRQPPNSGKENPLLELLILELKKLQREDVEFLRTRGLVEDMDKHNSNLVEAVKICYEASALLNEGYRDNKTVAMYENGSAKVFEALAGREKALDDLSGALRSSNALSKDALQRLQKLHQEFQDYNKFTRQSLTEAHVLVMTVIRKIRNKVNKET